MTEQTAQIEGQTELADGSVPVVVTTAHRGVFFGFTLNDMAGKVISLQHAQMCVYWSADVRGVPGLASHGPTKGCKVSRPIPHITLQDVTAVMGATDEAVIAWKALPWS